MFFTIGQQIKCINENNTNTLYKGYVYTVLDIKQTWTGHQQVKVAAEGHSNWYDAKRFVAVVNCDDNGVNTVNAAPTKKQASLENRFIEEVQAAIEQACDDNGWTDKYDAENDDYVRGLLDLSDNLGFNVEINMEPKVTVTKR